MDGIFILGKRPPNKKAVKLAAEANPESVSIERTALINQKPSGKITETMVVGEQVHFVGPDPYTKRVFYGTIKRTPTGFRVT